MWIGRRAPLLRSRTVGVRTFQGSSYLSTDTVETSQQSEGSQGLQSTTTGGLDIAGTEQETTSPKHLSPAQAELYHASRTLPFEQLPYQCFQEARKVLHADRQEKIEEIKKTRERIARTLERDEGSFGGGSRKTKRLTSLRQQLEKLKVQADIHDPLVRKRFQDGKGDLTKPVYRYLARLKWEAYDRKVGVQRIQQMQVIPDVLSAFEPVVDVRLHFRLKSVRPGQFINSRTSQEPATVSIQTFDREPKKITIAMVDPDIPDTGSDSFKENCHFLAANISVGPTSPSIDLAGLSANEHVILPWLPPFAQKGSPYHRLAILVLQQKEGNDVDVESMRQKVRRDGFKTRGFMGTYRLSPVGATMFRCIWDEGTEEVMKRAGIEGYDVEYRRRPIEPLPYRKRDSERFR